MLILLPVVDMRFRINDALFVVLFPLLYVKIVVLCFVLFLLFVVLCLGGCFVVPATVGAFVLVLGAGRGSTISVCLKWLLVGALWELFRAL